MFKKLKEKKGFTLVELIVVLVILAILAALLVPALTGYIDRAKKKAIIAETRQCVMAAQTLVDEKYAYVVGGTEIKVGDTDDDVTVTKSAIKELAEVKGEIGEVTLTTTTEDTTTTAAGEAVDKIATLEYTKGNLKCTYRPNPGETESNTDGDYNVTKAN